MKVNLEKGKVKCYERKTLEHSAKLGVSCPKMKKHRSHCTESDVHSISEKYLSHNKKENIGTLGQVGCEVSDNAKCHIHCTELDIRSPTGHPWYVREIFKS